MNKLATILLCINFITVLFPQPGYIHPDEFFQSPEIVAGDILGVEHFHAWEFNSSYPIRSVVFPYMMTGPSLYFLRVINSTGIPSLQISAVKVVMATRLPLAFFSVFGYLATGRLSDLISTDKYLSNVLWCSSYITWTYFTRTFSNSVEAVLFAMILLLILPSHLPVSNYFHQLPSAKHSSYSQSKKSEGFSETKSEINAVEEYPTDASTLEDDERQSEKGTDEKSESSETQDSFPRPSGLDHSEVGDDRGVGEQQRQDNPKERLHMITEESMCQTNFHNMTGFLLGAFVTAGVFNRPTFLVFVLVPVVYWLSCVMSHSHGRKVVHLLGIIFCGGLGAIVAFLIFVLFDTMYFNPRFLQTLSHIIQLFMNMNYSLETMSDDCNVLLSSIVITPWNFIDYNMNIENLAKHGLHPRYTHFIVNLPLLLGPLFMPIVIMCFVGVVKLIVKGPTEKQNNNLILLTLMAAVPLMILSVFPHQEPRFLIPLLPVFMVLSSKVLCVISPAKLSFLALWVVYNVLLTLVYGYMHQAALVPALSIYQQKLSSTPSSSTHHAIFYMTYPPPRHLLLINPDRSRVHIHDLAGKPVDSLVETVKNKKSECKQTKDKCQLYVFLPSTVTPRVLDLLSSIKVTVTSICPHLSMEAPPRFRAWWMKRLKFDEFLMDFCLNILKIP